MKLIQRGVGITLLLCALLIINSIAILGQESTEEAADDSVSLSVTGSQTVGIVGQRFNFTWSSGNDSNRDGTYSNYLYFFMGSQDTRPYGGSYT